jgi:hypothetical protein
LDNHATKHMVGIGMDISHVSAWHNSPWMGSQKKLASRCLLTMAGLIHPPIALLLAQKIPSWWEDIYIYINIIYICVCVSSTITMVGLKIVKHQNKQAIYDYWKNKAHIVGYRPIKYHAAWFIGQFLLTRCAGESNPNFSRLFLGCWHPLVVQWISLFLLI